VLDNIYDCIDCNMIDISITELFDFLASLNNTYSSGSDFIPPILLKNCHWTWTKPIHHLYNLSLKLNIFPKAWKVNYVTPIWKSGDRSFVSNYRPISKLNIISNFFKKILEPKKKIYFFFFFLLKGNFVNN
jgi:hypothetical protein